MNWLRKLFGRHLKVQLHMAYFAKGQGLPEDAQIFVNIANDGLVTAYVVRMTVAPTPTDRVLELGWEKFAIYPGDSREITIPVSSLGLTQIFNPKNFRVHLATGEIFNASVRKDVSQFGLTP
jgi:hypothetical protein